MKTNILVLSAVQPERESGEAKFPLCLTEFEGKSLLERIIDRTRLITDPEYSFAVIESVATRFNLGNIFKLLVSDARIIKIPKKTAGSACTALLAASCMDQSRQLLIISANELVDFDLSVAIESFKSRSLDAGTLTFSSIHPRYSYVRMDQNGLVVEAAQQNPISKNATTGVFWFRTTSLFVQAAKSLIKKNAQTLGDFYIAPTFNELILQQLRIGVIEISQNDYHPLKSDRQIQQFERGV